MAASALVFPVVPDVADAPPRHPLKSLLPVKHIAVPDLLEPHVLLPYYFETRDSFNDKYIRFLFQINEHGETMRRFYCCLDLHPDRKVMERLATTRCNMHAVRARALDDDGRLHASDFHYYLDLTGLEIAAAALIKCTDEEYKHVQWVISAVTRIEADPSTKDDHLRHRAIPIGAAADERRRARGRLLGIMHAAYNKAVSTSSPYTLELLSPRPLDSKLRTPPASPDSPMQQTELLMVPQTPPASPQLRPAPAAAGSETAPLFALPSMSWGDFSRMFVSAPVVFPIGMQTEEEA